MAMRIRQTCSGVPTKLKVSWNLQPAMRIGEQPLTRIDEEDGTNTAYLRGRKLHGKLVKLPQGYYGSVVEKSEAKPEPSRHEVAEDATPQEEPEDQLQVGAMQGKAAFDEMMIWDHESSADSSADPYVRSMEEWVTFTEQMHAYPTEPESPSE
ncbi:Uu.00g052560.m01.CDS01 [Anthostomella pinea]|uniref:Uu.00g052560.m01.CDS01 n=1 Tax=Anthostomella pinea TaxID=933095 RepID=A0AAI8VWA8_9PEZI|nr:Uu.00g052560.m01.CDS01 [Anthostomella pinea]